jgi:hypothetical protein
MANSTTTFTMDQTDAAMKAITAALADPSLSDVLHDALDQLSNFLQSIQDDLIEQSEQAMANALVAQNVELKALTLQINAEVKKLDAISATIKKVSSTVGILVSTVSGLVSGGFL